MTKKKTKNDDNEVVARAKAENAEFAREHGLEPAQDRMPKIKTPHKDLLPPLTTDEYAALKIDIKANGVRDAIITDEEGNILDGHHRYSIDRNAPRRVISGLTAEEKEAFVIKCNLQRRNLSPNQKADVQNPFLESIE